MTKEILIHTLAILNFYFWMVLAIILAMTIHPICLAVAIVCLTSILIEIFNEPDYYSQSHGGTHGN